MHILTRPLWRLRQWWLRLVAHDQWHRSQPKHYFDYYAECPGDWIECPFCHTRYTC